MLACGVILLAALARDEDPGEESDRYVPPPSPVEYIPSLLFAALPPAVGIAASLGAVWLTYSQLIPKNRQILQSTSEEVTGDEETPSHIQPIIAELQGLGFSALGQMRVTPPNSTASQLVWYLASADGLISAVIGAADWAIAPSIFFLSFIGDQARLETRYPTGMQVDLPTFQAQSTNQGIRQAYQLHQRSLHDLTARHGEPVRVDSLESFRTQVQRSNEVHGDKLRRLMEQRMFGPPVGVLVLSLGALALTLILYSPLNPGWLWFLLMLGIILALWAMLVLWTNWNAARRVV